MGHFLELDHDLRVLRPESFSDVPFYLRTGKRLRTKYSEIVPAWY